MARYYKKRIVRVSRDKYSVEQQAGALQVPANSQAWAAVVPQTDVQGMRKVKHLTVSLACHETSGTGSQLAYWALVYVPQGTTPSQLNITGTSGMYEPNQFVMNCGCVDFSAGPVRFNSPVSRNLNSGDKIVLIMANVSSSEIYYYYTVRYAVTLQ